MVGQAQAAGSRWDSLVGFGAAFGAPTKRDIERCRAAIAAAVWGESGKLRAVEVLFTVVLDGTQVDPAQAWAVDAFRQVRRLLFKNRRASCF